MGIELALAAALAFDLICPISHLGTDGVAQAGPFATLHLKVDLRQMRYCSGDCRSTDAIASASERQLILRKAIGDGFSFLESVNRESGDYMSVDTIGKSSTVMTAVCSPAPFSGFPTPRF